MIPKIIHYCWFGKGEKPKKIQKCINTWKENCPDYQIIEWNENNFDVNKLRYTKEAYKAKKYAFVSDVARVKALYEYGGIYLDTDVIVYKSFDAVLDFKCVLGFEFGNYIATSFMACESKFYLMKEFYNLYTHLHFYDHRGKIISATNVSKLTNMLLNKGLQRNNQLQVLDNTIHVYPMEYFSPYEYGYCIRNNTENTICEHLFLVSWGNKKIYIKRLIKKMIVLIIGKKRTKKIYLYRNRSNYK